MNITTKDRRRWTTRILVLAGLFALVQTSPAGVLATGGNSTNSSGNDLVHTFTSSGTFAVSSAGNVEVLVVAGGGGGGRCGGGGGGGGLIYSNAFPVSVSNYTVTVGNGGAGSAVRGVKGGNGSNSVFGTITATGGGGAGSLDTKNGNNGGSGGGAACGNGTGAGTPGSASPAGQGFNGGTAPATSGDIAGGGGGGSGAAGGNGGSNIGGSGGTGLVYSISGTATNYAGGGGGGASTTAGTGGSGGGGAGSIGTNNATAGAANTGGGGGGSRDNGGAGGNGANGGSGIVIVRYTFDANPPQISISAATNVAQTSAYLNGSLTSTGTSATAVWVYWGTNSGSTNASNWANTNSFGTTSDTPPKGYSFQATNLTPGQSYVYRYLAQNASGSVWTADSPVFTTFASPTVVNLDPTGIQKTTATLRGQVTGGNPAPQAYLCWGTADPEISSTSAWQHVEPMGIQSGAFSTNVAGLTAGATNYYRCYATNSQSDAWAPTVMTFTTAVHNTYTWDGTTNNWNVAARWGGALPGADDIGIVGNGIAQMNAVLTGAPTIQINAGGTAKTTADLVVTNLVLNGGKLLIDGWARGLGGTLNLQSDSWIQFNSGGAQKYTGALSGSGGLNITNAAGSTFNGASYFNNGASTSYTGNVHIYGSIGYQVAINSDGALGSNNMVYVENNGGLAINNAAIYRPVTLNGGTLALVVNCYMYGAVTVTAPSYLAGHYGMQGVNGQITSPYSLALSCTDGPTEGFRLKNALNASSWTGGMDIGPNSVVWVESAGSQGGGPINIRSGAYLWFGLSGGFNLTGVDAVTNDLTGSGEIDLRSQDWGSTRKALETKGNTITPGGADAVGTLTVNASSFTNRSALKIEIASGISYDVLKYAPDATYGSPFKLVLTGAVLQATLFTNAVFPGSSDYLTILENTGSASTIGTFDGLPEGSTINFGGATNCQITYLYVADSDSKSNDVALYNFSAPLDEVAPVVDNGAGVTNLLTTSAWLCGNVSAGSPTPNAYICYGLAPGGGTDLSAWTVIPMGSRFGAFSTQVTGLTPGANYSYRCFVSNKVDVSWSPVSNFTTVASTTYTWDGTTNNWDSTSPYHWIPSGKLPVDGDTGLVYNGTAILNAALPGGNPILVVGTGAVVKVSAALNPDLVLNGGQLWVDGWARSVGGRARVQSDSWILFANGGAQVYSGVLSGSGGLSITNGATTAYNGANNLNNPSSTGYVGTVHIYGASGCHVGIWDNGALGSNNTLIVEPNATLAVGSSSISRPITLNGGTLAVHAGLASSGPLTATAPSTLSGDYGTVFLAGPINSPYLLTIYSPASGTDGAVLRTAANSNTWSGGLDVATNQVYIDTFGSQGSGPIHLRSGTWLAAAQGSPAYDLTDANAFTNDLSGFGTFRPTTYNWGGALRHLEMKGCQIVPGGTGAVGTLTFNTASLTLTNNGATKCRLKVEIGAGGSCDMLKYLASAPTYYEGTKKLTLNGVDLAVTLLAGATYPLSTDVLCIVSNGPNLAISGTFNDLPEGAKLNVEGKGSARITYVGSITNYPAAGNDVLLYNFVKMAGSMFTIR